MSETTPQMTEEELRALVDRMKVAARKAPTYEQRLTALEKLEDVISRNKEPLVQAISADFGHRSRHETLFGEVYIVLSGIKYAKAHLAEWMQIEERDVDLTFFPGRAEVRPQPLGVVGIMAPWNYPMQLALGPLVAALAAGNRAVIKPSEQTPKTAELLARMMSDVFARDEVAVVLGDAALGPIFAKLPFDHLLFTGSTRVGKLVMQAASENLVPVTLELGGKSPVIVGDDYKLERAALQILTGKLFNAGQTCIAPDYVLVKKGSGEALANAFEAAAAELYPGIPKNADYTSIITAQQWKRLHGYLAEVEDQGGVVKRLGAEDDEENRKFAPRVLRNVPEGAKVLEEEIFGPILPIVEVESVDAAIEYVNERPRPLALYVFSHDDSTVEKVLDGTTSGGVTVNETLLHIAQDDLPFGGVGPSGMGHYHGREGFFTFSKVKPVFHQPRLNATGIMRPPYGKAIDTVLRVLVGK